jgi:hypothetical protein
MLCCFCSCCILYKKRQPRLNGGEYQHPSPITFNPIF